MTNNLMDFIIICSVILPLLAIIVGGEIYMESNFRFTKYDRKRLRKERRKKKEEGE